MVAGDRSKSQLIPPTRSHRMRRTCLVAAAVAGVLFGPSGRAVAQDDRGYGPWRLGMSKASVQAVAEYAPYKEVASTGGLETPNGVFEGRKTNISFVFGAGGLKLIQIWAYEGQSVDAALDAWHRVRQYLSRLCGAVEVPLLDAAADAGREEFTAVVTRWLAGQPQAGLVRLQMAPVAMPAGVSVFSSLFRHPQHGYFVFLYYREPKQDRGADLPGKGDESMENIAKDTILTCSQKFFPDKLQMHYAVTNRGSKDIYLLDVYQAGDPRSGKAVADYNSVYACIRGSNVAYLLKGIPPLPEDRTVLVRIMPLGMKLAPGQSIERAFQVPLPLREQNRWYCPPLGPEGYDGAKVKTLILAVQFLRSTIEGFNAEPAPHGPDLFRVRGKNTVGQAETMTCEIAVQDLLMLRRKDMFSRL